MEWIIIAIIAVWLAWRFMPTKGVQMITSADVKAMKKTRDQQWIDVRTPAEFKSQHVPGFINIPLNTLPKKLVTLDQNKEVIVLCQSGMRSSQAAKILKKNGFTNVKNVRGGLGSW